MTRVLLLGYDPETVDFSDPALPPGMTAEKVRAGIAVAMNQFAERGWKGDVGLIRPDETAVLTVERQLALLMAAREGTILAAPLGAKARMPDGSSGPLGGQRITQDAAARQGKATC